METGRGAWAGAGTGRSQLAKGEHGIWLEVINTGTSSQGWGNS